MLAISMVAGCAGDGKREPKRTDPQSSYLYRQGLIKVAVVQCLVDKELIPHSELKGKSWLENGKVASGKDFDIWYDAHPTSRYGGAKLEDWVAGADRVWPTSDCKALIPGAR